VEKVRLGKVALNGRVVEHFRSANVRPVTFFRSVNRENHKRTGGQTFSDRERTDPSTYETVKFFRPVVEELADVRGGEGEIGDVQQVRGAVQIGGAEQVGGAEQIRGD
jgi:hypothetical protein